MQHQETLRAKGNAADMLHESHIQVSGAIEKEQTMHVEQTEMVVIQPTVGAPWQLAWEKKCEMVRPFLAEGIATFFYVLFGCGATGILVVTAGQQSSRHDIALAFAFGIAFAIFFAFPISGGHTSITFTAALCTYRKFPWKLLPVYFIAHNIGAFIASWFVYLSFYSSLRHAFPAEKFPDLPLATSAIFVGVPAPGVSTGYLIWTEFIANVVLVFIVFSLVDNNNKAVMQTIAVVPIMVGLAVFVIAIGIGYQGIALNPARDLGARLFAATVYGKEVFEMNDHYFWIPLVIPVFGALVGGGLYDFFFYKHAKPNSN